MSLAPLDAATTAMHGRRARHCPATICLRASNSAARHGATKPEAEGRRNGKARHSLARMKRSRTASGSKRAEESANCRVRQMAQRLV